MAFKDYSTTPSANTALGDGTYIGPNMLRNKVRPALQQIAADGKALADEVTGTVTAAAAAAQAVIDATVFTVTSASGQTVSARGLLAGIAAPVDGQTAYLTEEGREGWFQFDTADLSALVTADTYQGIYVAPNSDATGASGAWVRIVADAYHLSWFGFTVANVATAHLRWRTLENLLVTLGVTSATRVLPAETFTGFGANIAAGTSAVTLRTPGHVRGQPGKTILDPNWSASDRVVAILHVLCSDLTISGIRGTRFQNDLINSDSSPFIAIGARHTWGATAAVACDRNRIIGVTFDEVDSPIKISRSRWGNTFYEPTDTLISYVEADNVGYQGIADWGGGTTIENVRIHLKGGITERPFHHAIRANASRKLRIHNLHVHDDLGVYAIALMRGGADGTAGSGAGDVPNGDTYSDAEDINISDVLVTGRGLPVRFYETSGVINLNNVSLHGDPLSTGTGAAFLVSHQAPMRNSVINITGGVVIGAGIALWVANANQMGLHINGTVFVGNSATPATASFIRIENAGNDALGNPIKGLRFGTFNNCKFIYPDGTGFIAGAIITNAVAGAYYSMRGCYVPFGTGANDISLSSGSATIDGAGTNPVLPAGFWTEHNASFSTNPRGVAY